MTEIQIEDIMKDIEMKNRKMKMKKDIIKYIQDTAGK